MSNTKTVMGQASNQYVVPLDITDVFSTYLYTGNGSTQTITNGIDLDGEGGLVWIKSRTGTHSHLLFDTERGATKKIRTDTTFVQSNDLDTLTAFNSNGFNLGADTETNTSGEDIASWTFRKTPKFFDVVTWTGTGAAMTIDHNLGQVPGMIIVKSTSATYNWAVSVSYTHLTLPTN